MPRKNSDLLLVVLFLLLVGIFYSTGPGTRELVTFTILSGLLVLSAFLIKYYYITGTSSVKQRVIALCMSFVGISVFYVAVKELAGFTLDYKFIIFIFTASSISMLWTALSLTRLEKVVLILTPVAILGVNIYEEVVITPSTATQFYHSELSEAESFEDIQELLYENYREDFTPADFRELEPYLQQPPLRFYRPALLEFKDGQVLLVEASRPGQHKPVRASKIELLPEKIAAYFRYYPLDIERKAEFPAGGEENEAIIEARGAFISRASFYQKRDWYEQLSSVFGQEETWQKLWRELEDVRAPEGPLRGAGINKEGYLEFKFREDWKVDQGVLDEIYVLFRDRAAEHGITDLPVVFKRQQ